MHILLIIMLLYMNFYLNNPFLYTNSKVLINFLLFISNSKETYNIRSL